MSQTVGQPAIVGQQQQPFAFRVETSHRIEPPLLGNQVQYRGPSPGVMDGGNVAGRFVEDQVDLFLGAGEGRSIHADLVQVGVHLGAQLCDHLPVDLHAPLSDQFLTGPPRGHPSLS